MLGRKKLDFKWTAVSKEGDVYVSINGTEYLYFLDAAHIPHFLRLYKRAKGKALAFLKKRADSCRKLEAGEVYR